MTVHVLVPDTKPSRADTFAVQLDAKLKAYRTDEARLSFLKGLLRNWQLRKDQFEERCKLKSYDPGDVTIFDFANTIAVIAVRLSNLECAMARARA